MLAHTPSFDQGNKTMLRDLDQNGIISYADYLFLLALLTSKHSL